MDNNEYFDSIEQLSIETEEEIVSKEEKRNAYLFSEYSDLNILSSDIEELEKLTDELEMYSSKNNKNPFESFERKDSSLEQIKSDLSSIEQSVKDKIEQEAREISALGRLKSKADESGITDIASDITKRTKTVFGKLSSKVKDTEIYGNIKEKGSSLAQKAKDTEIYETIRQGATELSEEISTRVKNIDSKSCKQTSNHRLYYVIGKVPGYNYQSQRFKSMNPSTYICKCLECGKEVSMLSNESNNLIVDPNYSMQRYEKARKLYLYYKLLNYSNEEIINEINNKLINEGPKLSL